MIRRTLLICLILSILSFYSDAQIKSLYPFRKGAFWGYIDDAGKEQIPARYRNAGDFTEGLASVRVDGTYGYINESGTLKIPNDYDYAEPFKHGLALVYLKGKPYLINKQGIRLFDHPFMSIESSGQNGLWIVKSITGQYGLVNQSGHVMLDTLYSRIEQFRYGKTSIERKTKVADDDFKYDGAIINTHGAFIVPFGTYEEISAVNHGYYNARYKRIDENDYRPGEVILDQMGRPVIRTSTVDWFLSAENYSPKRSVVSMKHGGSSSDYYRGVIDSTGNLLFSDHSWESITPFSAGRAFVEVRKQDDYRHESKWIMIDEMGRQVGNKKFKDVFYYSKPYTEEMLPFINGLAIVADSTGKWVIIDTNGYFRTKPIDLERAAMASRIRLDNRLGDVVLFRVDVSTDDLPADYKFGLWNTTTGQVIPAKYFRMDLNSTDQPLTYVVTDKMKPGYIDKKGRMIWQGELESSKDMPLNIDYMNRGYFYASGPDRHDLAGFGGWGNSDNNSKEFRSLVPYKPNDLSILIHNTDAEWRKYCRGRKVYLMNASHDTMYFPGQDSRLYMKVQAKDEEGNWKDIEYLPSSWCGNSYHTVALSPKQYWDFVMPQYEGALKTKLRIQLLYRTTSQLYEGNSNEVLYSNEVDGSINPAQFWRKLEYYPRGIMDSYND